MRAVASVLAACSALAAGLAAAPAVAWFTDGHAMVAAAAAEALPPEVPAFFRDGSATIAHLSVDPDVMKARETPQLRAQESPEHYLDLELLRGSELPADRYEYLEMLQRLEVDPAQVGMLPYAVIEGLQRLTLAFAEHRRWPQDPDVRTKALVYAGLLAHYAGDLVQPLHTTIHHDGRLLPDGKSPHTGIHQRVDALLERTRFDRSRALAGIRCQAFADPWQAILAQLAASHGLVDETYRLETQLLPPEEGASSSPQVTAFAAARYRDAVSFLASLYRTAWERSAPIELPSWLDRAPTAVTGSTRSRP
ncbi:MAG TPA: hypothetical protein VMT16_07020 [Thermoanaerobaculia bacterium]|nr:hypothetical protein [Thermoanaerobaculia bacterium]